MEGSSGKGIGLLLSGEGREVEPFTFSLKPRRAFTLETLFSKIQQVQ
jgi:hypothetical protein